MNSSTTIALGGIIDSLRDSPLFNLSLASKELFHSNFLAWLCIQHPTLGFHLFEGFLKNRLLKYESLEIERERKHFDLWLTFSGTEQLIIENKVKSIPELSQLERYGDAIKDKTHTAFLLLSLTRPAFVSNDWQFLSYRELSDKLRRLAEFIPEKNQYHHQLVDDYISFITHLDALYSQFEIKWDQVEQPFFLKKVERDVLASVRVHDLIEKLRYSQIAEQASKVLLEKQFKLHKGILQEAECGKLMMESGMTRSVGLVGMKFVLMNHQRFGKLILGVQVQGDHFRLIVETLKGGCAQELARALFLPVNGPKIWFDFAILPDESDEFPKEKWFNKFGDDFCYRSRRIHDISPRGLVDAIVAYARLIRENAAALQQQVKSVL